MKPQAGKDGYFYYLEDMWMSSDMRLTVFVYSDGRIVERVHCGPDGAKEFFAEFERVGFTSFDYESALEQAEVTLFAAADDESVRMISVSDGTEWKITISTDAGLFSVRRWNLHADFQNYGSHSDQLSKLVEVIELLTAFYGRCKVGLLP